MTLHKKIYLDYNATTPVDPRVLETMLPYFNVRFGNASSDHLFGWDAADAVEHSRTQVGQLLNCRSSEIIFTSGATEAANFALFGFTKRNRFKGKHIITSKTEHKAILDTMKILEEDGFNITFLNVDKEGNIDLNELERSITTETILVCLMMANNETGLIHPMQEIEKIVHSRGVKLMSDITQAVGKMPVDLKEMNLDLAVLSAHKLYGPKGVGALYINKKNRVEVDPHMFGGGQEKGMRAGTLNVPGIIGLGKAAEIAVSGLEEEATRMELRRNKLEELLGNLEGAIINSRNALRLPNTTSISFKEINGNLLLRKLNTLAVSRSAACTSNFMEPSHVLKAMGISDELALSSLRISLGRATTEADVNFAVDQVKKAVSQLRGVAI